MKITNKLHLAGAKGREITEFIRFKNGYGYVTNAHIAIKCFVEEEFDNFMLPIDGYKALVGKEITDINDQEIVTEAFRVPIVPLDDRLDGIIKIMEEGDVSSVERIGYNISLLKTIAEATGWENCVFEFNGNNKASVITPTGGSNEYAIIMPAMIEI